MRVLFFSDEDGVDVSGGAAELAVLALALAAGKGGTETTTSAEPSFGGTELASVEVVSTPAARGPVSELIRSAALYSSRVTGGA